MLLSSVSTLTNVFLRKAEKCRFADLVAVLPPSCDHSMLSNGAIQDGSILHLSSFFQHGKPVGLSRLG